LLAYPFDSARIQITGEPVSVAERIRYESGLARGAFTVSETGTLVYGDIDRSSTHLVWFDREGTRIGSVGGALAFGQPALSPDQRTVAVEHVDPITQDQDLWLIDLVRNVPSRFTSQGNNITFMPIWSPDGERIAFASARGTPPNLYQKASIGTGTEQLLLESASNSQPTDWSGAAQAIVFAAMDPQTQWDLWTMPMSGAGEQRPTLLLRTEFNEHLGRVSPDGRWLAYVSDESGANEVYVRPLARPGPKKRISANGANEPKWRGDGRELFYLAADGRVLAVAVHDGISFEFGSPAPLFQVRTGPTRNFGYDVNYAVTRDGQRFVIRELAEDSEAASATTVVLNWRASLGQR
jgi:Tol biopolymer transport system component